jgi:Fur family zinc uptake transcriptional regulator
MNSVNHEGAVVSPYTVKAIEIAARRGVSLTDTRRFVLELLLEAARPVGAYRILETMQVQGARAMPPTVYRALNFLLENGLVHRIESLNAFIACTQGSDRHDVQFLICDTCGGAEEIADSRVSSLLQKLAKSAGFRADRQIVEVKGQCGDCGAR